MNVWSANTVFAHADDDASLVHCRVRVVRPSSPSSTETTDAWMWSPLAVETDGISSVLVTMSVVVFFAAAEVRPARATSDHPSAAALPPFWE